MRDRTETLDSFFIKKAVGNRMKREHSQHIVLAAGGTGGHIFPAEALAEQLLARGYIPHLLTDDRFDDYAKHQAYGAFTNVAVHRVATARAGGSLLTRLRNALGIFKGVRQARRLLQNIAPIAVVGFGGYPSFPTMLAACLRGDIALVQEQNSVLGRVNRVLAPWVKAVGLTYAHTLKLPPSCQEKSIHVGNPVRAQVRVLAQIPYVAPAAGGLLHLLIVGGSQGASVFAETVPAAMALLPEEVRVRIRVDQQCRAQDMVTVKEAYAQLGMQAEVQPFFSDMSARLASAHLVIARAGASTVSELCVAGRPAILVPLPIAADNHQYYNAQVVEDVGGGVVMPQSGFTPQALAARLETYVNLPLALDEASQRIRSLARVDAAERLADLVLTHAGVALKEPLKVMV